MSVGFDEWINQRLEALEFAEEENSTDLLLKVAKFWMLPDSKRFFDFANRLCRGSERMQYRLSYSNLLLQNVLNAMDEGNLYAASAWLISFGLLMEQELKTLIDVIYLIEKAKTLTQNHDEVCECLRSQTPYLVLCFYFCESRARITEWLLKISQTLFVNDVLNSDVAFTRCWITIAYKTKGTKTELFINQTVQLKTLMMLLEINPRTYRLVHRGRTLFLTEGADEKRLHELGVKDQDVIILVDVPPKTKDAALMLTNGNCKSQGSTVTNTNGRKSSVFRSKRTATRRSSADYSIAIPHRVSHSVLLSRVFEEANAIFAERRRALNELAIKKSHPKPRQSKAVVNTASTPLSHNTSLDGIGGKPGKTRFPITVGEPNFLYRSSKVKAKTNVHHVLLDLHGCSKEEAIARMNDMLPNWIDMAMKNHPYTLNADIICGGGNQILSETVESWIKGKNNVANRFG